MDTTENDQPFIDTVRASYALAVKRWSRDVLIAGFVLVLVAIFIVWPFTGWSQEILRIENEKRTLSDRRQALERVSVDLKAIESEALKKKDTLDHFGQLLARELSDHLSQFGAAIIELKSGCVFS